MLILYNKLNYEKNAQNFSNTLVELAKSYLFESIKIISQT